MPPVGRLVISSTCLVLFIFVLWYHEGMLEKEYASSSLGFALAYIENSNTRLDKQERILKLLPYLAYQNGIIQEKPGYWKPIYKVYHEQASLLLLQGRPWDAVEKLEIALRFHPYYAAAYKMIGNIKGMIGLDKEKDACYTIYQDIFQSKKPSEQDMKACLNLQS